MILSHKHKFIFIKTPKTAGTSIEIALSRFCGDKDIITPIAPPEDEQIRSDLGYRGPQNYMRSTLDNIPDDLPPDKPHFFNHITGPQIRSRIPEKIWNNYFKFCVVRNPWDQLVSHYFWLIRKKPYETFHDYMMAREYVRLAKKGAYFEDGNIIVDKVCRFEYLTSELEDVRLKLKLPEKLDLPRAKSGTRPKGVPYQEYYDTETMAMVAEHYSQVIDWFGYEF